MMLVPEHTALKVPESRLVFCHCSKWSPFFSSGSKPEQLTQGSANPCLSPNTQTMGVPSASTLLRLTQNTVIPPEIRWQVGTKNHFQVLQPFLSPGQVNINQAKK